MDNYERYIISAASIVVAVYLHSPIVALIPLLMYGVKAAENVVSKSSKDAEIVAIMVRVEGYEKRVKVLEQDVVNVAERAKTILGESY